MTADERQRLSAIAHSRSPMWGPIAEPTIAEIVHRIEQHGGQRIQTVLDLGCGPAELLRRVCERTGAAGTGVDASPYALEEAERRLSTSPARDRIQLRLADVGDLLRERSHDLVICVGPGWPAGGWSELTSWAGGFVSDGGLLLLGEGAWRRQPSVGTLDRLDMAPDDYISLDAVEAAVSDGGAEPLWAHRSTAEEWSRYADDYRGAMLAFVEEHPDDPIAPAVAERAGPGWTTFELLHSVLGFAVVLGRPRD